MNLNELRTECLKIKGVKSVRKAKLGDGIFIKFKDLFSNGKFYYFTDFIHLDTWQDSLRRCKMEYEKFFN